LTSYELDDDRKADIVFDSWGSGDRWGGGKRDSKPNHAIHRLEQDPGPDQSILRQWMLGSHLRRSHSR
jgi:hypothetical protein